MRLPYSLSQERHTSSREAPTSSTLPPYHINQHVHLYMRDPLPWPSLASSAPSSPTLAIRSTKGWLTTLQNLLTNVKKKIANGLPSKTAGSRASRTTSTNFMPTSKTPSAPSRMSQLISTYMASPYLSPRPRPDLSLSHSAFTRPQQLPPCLPFLEDPLPPSHHPSHRVPVPSGHGHPL